MSLTGLNNISGLSWHKGTVGMSSERGSDGGNSQVAKAPWSEVGGGSQAGDEVDGDLSLTLLTSVHNSSGGVHVGGTKEGVVAMGGLGGVVGGGGGGAVGVGDQVGGRVKSLCLPLAIVVDGMDKARRVNSEGVDQLASL